MNRFEFTAIIKIRGINPFVEVDAELANTLKAGWRKPLPVIVRIHGQPAAGHRTNLMPSGGGNFYLYLNGIVRSAAGVGVGDYVQLEIEFDAAYRNGPLHPMPRWFRKALKENASAEKNWNALSPSRKKELLRYFAQLKSPPARARNAQKALYVLSGKTGRFMGRTWIGGV